MGGTVERWHDVVMQSKYNDAGATNNITVTQADYDSTNNTITWTITFNPKNGIESKAGTFQNATSVYSISISKDLKVKQIKYGWNGTMVDITDSYKDSSSSQKAVAVNKSDNNGTANEMTVTNGSDKAYEKFKSDLVTGPLFNYIKDSDIGTNITLDSHNTGKALNQNNSKGLQVQVTTEVNTTNLGAFTGVVAGESFVAPDVAQAMGTNAFKTPRVLGVYRAANITVTNKGTEGVTSEAIPVKVTYNGSETVPSDVTSVTYTINKNAANLKKADSAKYANATDDSIQVTTNDWNKGYYDTESVSYPYYYDTNTLKDDLLNNNALSLSNISVNGSPSKLYNTSTSIQNGALVINITAWDQPATGTEITVEKGTTLTPDLVAQKSISNYEQLKAEGYTFSFNNDVDTSKEGTGNYGLLIRYPDYTEANNRNTLQSITVHVTDSSLNNAKKEANEAIDKLDNLNDAQKQAAKKAVDAATSEDGIKTAKNNASSTDTNMKSLRGDDNLNSPLNPDSDDFKGVDDQTKQVYKKALEAAQKLTDKNSDENDSVGADKDAANAQTIKDNLDNAALAMKKAAATAAIDKMDNLNDAQKAAAKAAVTSASDADAVKTALDNATSTNTNMGDLKTDKNLTNPVDENDPDFANASKEAQDKYKEALDAAKKLVDLAKGESVGAAQDAQHVKEIQTALAQALANLKTNAADKLQAAKDAAKEAINNMGNLNDAQKKTALDAVDAAQTVDAVNGVQTNVSSTDKNMGDLAEDENYKNADTIKQGTNYQNADQKLKDAYDEAIQEVKDLLGKTTGSSTGNVVTDPAAVKAAKKKLDDALAALNGDDALQAAKNAAKEAINNMGNLNDAQKKTALDAVDAAKTTTAVSTAQSNAGKTNTNMGNLENDDNYKNADTIKQGTNYQNADQKLKDAYDKAIQEAKDLLGKTTGSSTGNVTTDPAAVEAAKKKVDDALAALNGDDALQAAKNTAKAAIEQMGNLNDAQKKTALDAVDAAKTTTAVSTAQSNAGNTNTNMGNLENDENYKNADTIKQGTNYQNADQKLKDAYDKALQEAQALLDKAKGSSTGDASTDPAAVDAAKQKLDAAVTALNGDANLQAAKDAAKKAIEGMDNLNNAQKQTALDAVDAAETTGAVTAAQTNTDNTNTNMGDLEKDDNYKNADTIKQGTNYQNADEGLKKAYDDAVKDVATLLGKETGSSTGDVSTDPAAVKAAKQKLDDALAALNGNDALQKAKNAAKDNINKMANLNNAQKKTALDAVDAAETTAAVTTAQTNAKQTNTNMGDLASDENYKNAETIKQGTNYQNADEGLKKAYDDAVKEAATLINKETGASTGNTSTDPAAVESVKQKLDAALAALNGDDILQKAKNAAKDAINKMGNLNNAQKKTALDTVDAALTPAAVTTAQTNAKQTDTNMEDLANDDNYKNADTIKQGTNYQNADEGLKKAFDDAVKEVTTLLGKETGASTGNTSTDPAAVEAAKQKLDTALDALNGNDNLQNAKNAAKQAIDDLKNLNKAQKEAAIAKVNAATTKDAIQPIVDTATALDSKMGDLKKVIEAANAKKQTTAYTQAGDTKEFDTALTNATTLDSDKGDNEDANAVQTKIDALTNAKLDGENQLANAKNDAIEKINALKNLNKAQKQAAIEAVNSATTKDAIQPIVDTATALDGKMSDLKKAIADANAKKATTAYTQASDTKNFDDALDNANTLNSDKGDNEDANAVQAKIDALNNVKLDGEKVALQKAIAEANAKIDGTKPDSTYYNADSALQQAYQDAVTKAQRLLEQRDSTDEDYKAAREAIDAAQKALNGQATDKAQLQKAYDQVDSTKKSDSYIYESSANREAYDKAAENAKAVLADPNATQAQVDEALAKLNDAMKNLHGVAPAPIVVNKDTLKAEVKKQDQVHASTAYTNASEAGKKAYDEALAQAEKVLADSNATQAQIDEALANLKAATAKLDGKDSAPTSTTKNSNSSEKTTQPIKTSTKSTEVNPSKKPAHKKLGTNADRLPQTGSHQSEASVIGLGIAALALAVLGFKKRKDEE